MKRRSGINGNKLFWVTMMTFESSQKKEINKILKLLDDVEKNYEETLQGLKTNFP